jgi:hypothetical protein
MEITMHLTLALVLMGLLLSLSIWAIRCFRIGLNPAHRNVKNSYLSINALVWVAIVLLLIN